MLRLLAAAVTGLVVAGHSPSAVAGHVIASCEATSVSNPQTTGTGVYEGVVAGYAVGAPTESVAVTCTINVNDTPVVVSQTGSGTMIATTVWRITYSAGPNDTVTVCALVSHSHADEVFCHPL